jgi:maltose O-acetyltransferase
MLVSNPLAPRAPHVLSRRWALYVNVVAASPLVTNEMRARILRRCGLDVGRATIWPDVYFHTADIHLADGVILNNGVHIENCAHVEIGRNTGLGIHTVVITSTHDIGSRERRYAGHHYLPVTFGAGCWIGARSTILPGVTIGDGCLVAAGSVVTKDLEPDGVYAGIPARRVRDLPAGAPDLAHAGAPQA